MTPSDLDEFIAANTGVAVRVDEGPSRVTYYVDGLPHHVETFTELVNRLTPYGVNATVELETTGTNAERTARRTTAREAAQRRIRGGVSAPRVRARS